MNATKHLRFTLVGPLVALSLGVSACGGDDAAAQQCLAALPTCTPSVTPEFSTIYSTIIQQHCGISGTGPNCHGPDGRKAGLGMFDADTAFNDLTGVTGRARVLAGDPECSILMERLASTDPNFRMPPGQGPLDPGLRCAIQIWIENGATKN